VFLLLFLVTLTANDDVTVLRTFDPLPTGGEDYLAVPFSMDFHKNKLYLMDRDRARIFVWDEHGHFVKAFGKRGEGPGEMFYPQKLCVRFDEVWVWDFRGQMTLFELDGTYKTSFPVTGIEPRNFALLSAEKALLGIRNHRADLKMDMQFQWLERGGKAGEILKTWPNETLLRPLVKGTNKTTIKAYSPEVDIQRDGEGNIYFGFSQNRTLYKMDKDGKISGEQIYELPTAPPTDEERKVTEELSFPLPNGGRRVLADIPGLHIAFDHDKAYYTQFLIRGEKVVFVLTPLGSMRGVGNGFYRATYRVNDLKTGKLLGGGRYQFPIDSAVFYRNGRILACMAGEEGYTLQEIELKGM
jgi:hypothetical protein